MSFLKDSIACWVFGMYAKSHCIFYCSLLKYNDVINLENACEYFAMKSLLMVSQVPSLDLIRCFKIFLWNSSISQSYVKCSDDCAPSSQGHIGLSVNLKPWKYDFVFPWPEAIAVNPYVTGIFNFSLCFSIGKNDLHSAPLSVFSHCVCHFVKPYFFSSVAIFFICFLLYSIFSPPSSSAASLATLSASTFRLIPICAFTHPKWTDQVCVMSCRTLFRMFSIKGLCIKLFVRKAKVTLLSG